MKGLALRDRRQDRQPEHLLQLLGVLEAAIELLARERQPQSDQQADESADQSVPPWLRRRRRGRRPGRLHELGVPGLERRENLQVLGAPPQVLRLAACRRPVELPLNHPLRFADLRSVRVAPGADVLGRERVRDERRSLGIGVGSRDRGEVRLSLRGGRDLARDVVGGQPAVKSPRRPRGHLPHGDQPQVRLGLTHGILIRRRVGGAEQLLVERGVAEQQLGGGFVLLLLAQRQPDGGRRGQNHREHDDADLASQDAPDGGKVQAVGLLLVAHRWVRSVPEPLRRCEIAIKGKGSIR